MFLKTTWWQKGDSIVVQPLSGFHAMYDTDLWPPCKWICGYRNGLEKMRIRSTIWPLSVYFGKFLCFTLLKDAGLDPWLFLPASLSWKDWVNDSIQSLDHGTGNPKRHTVTSFLLSLFRDLILQEPLENGKETSLFLFRLRGMWHSIDGFCRIGSPEVRLSFFFWSRNVG